MPVSRSRYLVLLPYGDGYAQSAAGVELILDDSIAQPSVHSGHLQFLGIYENEAPPAVLEPTIQSLRAELMDVSNRLNNLSINEDEVNETATNKKFSATNKSKLEELYSALTAGVPVVNGKATLGNVAPAVTIASVSSPTAAEGANLVFNVALTGVTTVELTLPFSIAGTATGSTDYALPLVATGATVSGANIIVPIGASSFTVMTTTSTDALTDGSETCILIIGGVAGTGTITDVAPAITVASVSSPTAAEGANLVFNVVLSGLTTVELTLPFSTAGGTAVADIDYATPLVATGATVSGTNIIVPIGTNSFTVTTLTSSDLLTDAAETLILTIAGITGTGTITDVAPEALPTNSLLRGDNIGGIQYYANGGLLINEARSGTRLEGSGVVVDQKTGDCTLQPGQSVSMIFHLLVDPNIGYITPGLWKATHPSGARINFSAPAYAHRMSSFTQAINLATVMISDVAVGDPLNQFHGLVTLNNTTASPIVIDASLLKIYAVSNEAELDRGFATTLTSRIAHDKVDRFRAMSQLSINGSGIDRADELTTENDLIWHNGQTGGNAALPYTMMIRVAMEMAIHRNKPVDIFVNFPVGASAIRYTTDAGTNRVTVVNHGGDHDLLEGEPFFILQNSDGVTGFPVVNTTYYARNIVGATFQCSTTVNGAIVNLLTTDLETGGANPANKYSIIYSLESNIPLYTSILSDCVNTTIVLDGVTYSAKNTNIIRKFVLEPGNEVWHFSGVFSDAAGYCYGPAAVLAGGAVGETGKGYAYFFNHMVSAMNAVMAAESLPRSRFITFYGVQTHNPAGLGVGLNWVEPVSGLATHNLVDDAGGSLYLTPIAANGTRIIEGQYGYANFYGDVLLSYFEGITDAQLAVFFERSLADEGAKFTAMVDYFYAINPNIRPSTYEAGHDVFYQQSYNTVTVTIGVSSGTFTAIATGGVTITNNGTASVTLVGSLGSISSALTNSSHSNTTNLNGNVTVTITTNVTPFNNVQTHQFTASSGTPTTVFTTQLNNSTKLYIIPAAMQTRMNTMLLQLREFVLNSPLMQAINRSLAFLLLEKGAAAWMNFGDFGDIVTNISTTNIQAFTWSAGYLPTSPKTGKQLFLDSLSNYVLSQDAVSTITATSPVNEGGTATFTITLAQPSASVRYVKLDVTGSASTNDYVIGAVSNGATLSGKILTVPANVTSITIDVAIADDAAFEYNETIVLAVGAVSGTATILFNDGATTANPVLLDFTNQLALVAANQLGGRAEPTLLTPNEVRFDYVGGNKGGEINVSSLLNTLANGVTATLTVKLKTTKKATQADFYASSVDVFVRNTGAYVSGSGAGNSPGRALQVDAVRSLANLSNVTSTNLIPKTFMGDTDYVTFELDIKNYAGRDLTVADTVHFLLRYGSADGYDLTVKDLYR